MAWWLTKLTFDAMIMGSDIATFGAFMAVLLKMKESRTAAGLSLQSLIAILTLRVLHLCSHMWSIHYVPKVLPMLPFKFFDFAVVGAGVLCVVAVLTHYYSSYEVEKDNFGIQLFDRWELLPTSGAYRLRPLIAASFLYIVAGVVATVWYMVRKTIMNSYSLNTYTCFSEAMSAVALLPQLWMFQHDKRVDAELASFVVMIAVNRFCTFSFWTFLPMLVGKYAIPKNRGVQMALEAMNLLILADFLYYYVRAKLRGDKEIILSSDCDV